MKCCDKTVAQCYGRWEWFMNDAQYGNSFFWEFSVRIESNNAVIRILDIGSNSCTLVGGYIM